MKQTIRIVSLALITILLFTACTKNKPDTTETTSSNEVATVSNTVTAEPTIATSTTTDPVTTETEPTTTEILKTTEPSNEPTTNLTTTTPTTATAVVETTKKDMPTFEGPTSDELQVLDLVNAEREKAGVHKLSFNYKLYNCAKYRATETVTHLSHTRPDGTRYFTILEDYGIPHQKTLGENICYRFPDIETAVKVLMDSPSHKENILHEKYNSLSIGIIPLENGTYTMVQLFEG